MRNIGLKAARLFRPSLTDCFFISLLLWLFALGGRWSSLLADGDTGWHIRTGEMIFGTGQWPARDPFSFSKAGESWYAWGWLSDCLMAISFRVLGLEGVAVLAGVVIVLGAVVVFRHMLWRRANPFVALAVSMLAIGAASLQFLARPLVFTLLLWAVSLWLIEKDRCRPTRRVWLLAPMATLWANLHGGFIALPVSLAILAAGSVLEAVWGSRPVRMCLHRALRYGLLSAICTLASLINPYGVRLHLHIAGYLCSDWIREAVDEFQSPRFRSENALYFEILLFGAVMLAASLARRHRFAEALLLIFWAHAALVSARHIPLFAMLSAPGIAARITVLWRCWSLGKPSQTAAVILKKLGCDLRPSFGKTSLCVPLAITLLAFTELLPGLPAGFPKDRFPVELIERHRELLAETRVFTSDEWADYLIYRSYPRQKVFFDGRSDFYGPVIGWEYASAVQGRPGWEDMLDRYKITLVLAPAEWPLSHLLRQHPGWRQCDGDALGLLFARTEPRFKELVAKDEKNFGCRESLHHCSGLSTAGCTPLPRADRAMTSSCQGGGHGSQAGKRNRSESTIRPGGGRGVLSDGGGLSPRRLPAEAGNS